MAVRIPLLRPGGFFLLPMDLSGKGPQYLLTVSEALAELPLRDAVTFTFTI